MKTPAPLHHLGTFLAGLSLLVCLAGCDTEPKADSGEQNGMGGNTVSTRETVTTDLIGKVRRAEFERMNTEGVQAVTALQASAKTLLPSDQALLREVASAGQGQLALSQAAAGQLEHAHAATLAEAEQTEQRAFNAKLKELAGAYQVTLPAAPSAEAQAKIQELKGLQGRDRDVFYLREAGVAGHQSLESLMNRLESQAQDTSLQQLATLSLPLIRAHLQVSEDVANELSATALGAP